MNADNIIIFTDLDGSLLNHDDFQFKKIRSFIINCLKNNFDNYESMASLIHQFRFGTTEKDLGRKFGVICNLPGVLKV